MADNITIKDGADADQVVACDEVSRNAVTEKQQIVKIGLGAEGAHDLLLDSGQQTSANSLPVVLPSDAADVKVTLDSEKVAIASIDAGDNNIGNVDVATVPAPLSTTGGGTEAAALRVTVASDSTGVLSVDDNAGSLTVDATDLDIRDLSQASDSVKVGDGTALIDIDVAPTDGETNGGKRLLHTEAWLWGYNGVSWDRLRSDTTNGLDVDVTRLPALPAGTNNIGDVDVLTVPAPLSTTGGGTEAAALRVTLASDSTGLVSVDDNAGSLTVDAPVGTPVFVRLSDGASAITALPVTDNGGALTVDNGGTFAVQATLAAETTKVIGTVNKAEQSTIWKCVQSSTATTTNIWTPGSGKKIALAYLQIQAGGTTAGNVQVWFAASGDTTYNRGTDAVVFDGEFAPSNTLKPGIVISFPIPIICPTADYLLKVTASAAINPLTVTAWGYEV